MIPEIRLSHAVNSFVLYVSFSPTQEKKTKTNSTTQLSTLFITMGKIQLDLYNIKSMIVEKKRLKSINANKKVVQSSRAI
jgi:hypothetical protein